MGRGCDCLGYVSRTTFKLTVTIQSPAVIDVDVFIPKVKEEGDVVEQWLDSVGLLIVGIVRELDKSLETWTVKLK